MSCCYPDTVRPTDGTLLCPRNSKIRTLLLGKNNYRLKMKFIKNNLSLIIVDVSASVKAETSTIINKRLFFNEFHFEIVYRSTYK